MHKQTVVQVCEACGTQVGESLQVGGWATESPIGPACGPCPSCGALLDTGRREWADMSAWRRLSYLGGLALSCALGVLVWGGGGAALLVLVLRLEPSWFLWIFGCVSLTLACRVILNVRREISESLRRSRQVSQQSGGDPRPGDGPPPAGSS